MRSKRLWLSVITFDKSIINIASFTIDCIQVLAHEACSFTILGLFVILIAAISYSCLLKVNIWNSVRSVTFLCYIVAFELMSDDFALPFPQAKRDLNDPENAIIGAFAGNIVVKIISKLNQLWFTPTLYQFY